MKREYWQRGKTPSTLEKSVVTGEWVGKEKAEL